MNEQSPVVRAMLAEPDLIRVMSTRTAYAERKAALERLLIKAWQAGYDACESGLGVASVHPDREDAPT